MSLKTEVGGVVIYQIFCYELLIHFSFAGVSLATVLQASCAWEQTFTRKKRYRKRE